MKQIFKDLFLGAILLVEALVIVCFHALLLLLTVEALKAVAVLVLLILK